MSDRQDLARRLRRYSRACVADKLDGDFADAVREAADQLEAHENGLRAVESFGQSLSSNNKYCEDHLNPCKKLFLEDIMNDVTFTIDQIRKTAVELVADRSGPLDATWAAYAKGAADLCLALSALAGEEDDR